MNEQEIEGQLARLAHSDEGIRSPETLRRFMHSLEGGSAKPNPASRVVSHGPLKWRMPGMTALRAIGSLAVTVFVAAVLLVAVVPRQSSTRGLVTAAGPTFGASSWTKLFSFAASSQGDARATAMRQSDGLIYGLVYHNVEHQTARWGTYSGPQVSVAQTVDGRKWTLGDALSDPVVTLNVPPMDSSSAYNAVAKRGNRWVVVGGLVGAPAQVALGDGNQPVQSVGMAWVSDDGISWRQPSSAQFPGYELQDVVATDWGFVATGIRSDGSEFGIWTSSNGETWQAALLPAATAAYSLAGISFDPAGGYLVVGQDGAQDKVPLTLALFHSLNGHEWTETKETKETATLVAADLATSYENGAWTVNMVAVDRIKAATSERQPVWEAHLETVSSPDGVSWTSKDPSTEFEWPPLIYSVRVPHGTEMVGFAAAAQGPGSTQPATAATGPVLAATAAVTSPATPGPTGSQSATASGQTTGAELEFQAIRIGRTVDLSSWTPAGTGPSGVPTDALATANGPLLFVYQRDDLTSSEWVEVWSAPWP
jgi:hypothetical protein